MPIFRYEATEASGRVLRGAMDATSSQDVEARLSGKGYTRIEVQGTAQAQATQIAPPAPDNGRATVGLQPAARAEDLGLFFRQMASLLHSGMTPGAALSNLSPRTANPKLQSAGRTMAQNVANGASWAGELARTNGLIPEHIVGLVAAGETGGFLPFACEEAALSAEQDAALRQGLGWVRFLIWQSIWSVLLFQPLFPSIDTKHFEDIKGHALTFLKWQAFLCVPLGIALHLGAYLGGKWWASPAGAHTRDSLSLKILVMAKLHRARALASFTRVLSRLLRAGVGLSVAYEAAAKAVPNSILRTQVLRGLTEIRAARGLDSAIQATGLMEHDPVQLLVTGQQTGQLTETLDQVTAFYQEEAARATDVARKSQKQLAGIITIVSMGYVTILATYYMMKMGFQIADGIAPE